jgi:hypothetical protein
LEHLVTIWPLKEEPWFKTAGLLCIAMLSLGLAVYASDGWAVAAFATLVFCIALAPYFVPTMYRIDSAGITVQRPWRRRHIAWTAFKALRQNRFGVWLLPFEAPQTLDGFRQLYLPLRDAARRGEVYRRLAEAIALNARKGAQA